MKGFFSCLNRVPNRTVPTSEIFPVEFMGKRNQNLFALEMAACLRKRQHCKARPHPTILDLQDDTA
jgi:hypothetical protein